MANLKTISDLKTEIETIITNVSGGAAGPRGVSISNFVEPILSAVVDAIESNSGVGGVLNISNGSSPNEDVVCDGNFNLINVWSTSTDTKGVTENRDPVDNHLLGTYELKNNADGDWTTGTNLRFTTDTAGTYRCRVVKINTDDTVDVQKYRDRIDLGVDEIGHMAVIGGLIKNLVSGEKLGLEFRGPNNAVVTFLSGQFAVERKG